MSERQLEHYRLRKIGFVFQFFNLIPSLSAIENLELPMLIAGTPEEERRARAETLLETVGLQTEGVQAAGGALRRRAAAGCGLPRAGQQPLDHSRRRADRQSRQRQQQDHRRSADQSRQAGRQDGASWHRTIPRWSRPFRASITCATASSSAQRERASRRGKDERRDALNLERAVQGARPAARSLIFGLVTGLVVFLLAAVTVTSRYAMQRYVADQVERVPWDISDLSDRRGAARRQAA